MGMAACAEIGDETGLFQPAHGSAPDIMGQDKSNPLAAVLSSELMSDDLAEKSGLDRYAGAAKLIEDAVQTGFEQNRLRPMEIGGDMGTKDVTRELLGLLLETKSRCPPNCVHSRIQWDRFSRFIFQFSVAAA